MAGTWQQTEWLQSEEVDQAIVAAPTTLDDGERAAAYAKIQKQAAEECWGIAVAEQVEEHAYCDNIEIPAVTRAAAGEKRHLCPWDTVICSVITELIKAAGMPRYF